MIFHLGHPFATRQNGRVALQPNSVLVGHLGGPMLVQASGPYHSIGVRFRPGGHFPFFPMPGRNLDRRVLSLEFVSPGRGTDLSREVTAAGELEGAYPVIEDWLLSRATRSASFELVQAVLAEIMPALGMVSIPELSQQMGVSLKTLERNVLSVTGLTPKQFCRLVRFLAVLETVYEGGARIGAQLATDLGYYDQAHLIRDFREFAGAAPGAYARTANLGRFLFSPAAGASRGALAA